MLFDPVEIVRTLSAHDVRYVAIGMFAAVVQGAAHDTEDIDISYEASLDNCRRLAAALNELGVRFRVEGHSEGLEVPGGIDERTLTGT